MTNTRARLYALGALVLSLLVAACGDRAAQNQTVVTTTDAGTSSAPLASEVGNRNNALVRFVHAIPGVAATDLFAGDTKTFSNVSYKAVTPYKELPTERQMIRLRLAGQDTAQPLAENSERFSAGGHYTVIAYSEGDRSSAELQFVADGFAPPSSGKAKVRVILAAPDVGDVDVYVGGRSEALSTNIGFASKPSYAEVDPLTGALEVRLAGKNIAALTLPSVRFEAGRMYTVMVVGRAEGASKLEAVIIEDHFGGAAASGATQ